MSGVHGGRPDELAPATVSTKAIVYLTAMCANAPRARVSISRSFDWPHLTWLSSSLLTFARRRWLVPVLLLLLFFFVCNYDPGSVNARVRVRRVKPAGGGGENSRGMKYTTITPLLHDE